MIPPQRFELPEHWKHVPGLKERVYELYEGGRYRSAMDEVLRHLRHDPSSIEPMYLALTILSHSRTSAVISAEPLTPLQRASALLAPITTECSVCQSRWYSGHEFFLGMKSQVMNPRGLQCQDCRYTLCSDCWEWQPLTDLRRPCPAPGCQGTLDSPVLSTGRHDVTPMDPDSIERVIVVREGPITPSMDEALAVVTKFVPLLPDDAPLIRICPGARGMMNEKFTRNRLALSLVQGLERDGVLAPGAWARSRPLSIRAGAADDTDYLVTVVRKPDSTPHNQPLVHVHVLLESPNRIDPDYMTTFLQVMAPEVFENSPTIRGVPVHPWRDDPQGLVLAIVCEYHQEYFSGRYDIAVFDGRDQDGIRWALVKVFSQEPKHVDPEYPPDSSPDSAADSGEAQTAKVSPWRRLWRRITAVRQPDATPSPDWDGYVTGLMAEHVRRMVSQIPETTVGECWSGLGGDEVVTATTDLLHQGLLEARQTHDLATTTCAVAKYEVAATVVLTSNIDEARDRFVDGYLAYFEELINRLHYTVGSQRRRTFVHWIMSFDGATAKLDATVLPADKNETALFAVDLLTPAERQRLGL